MESEYKKQLNLTINGHMINLRDEAITEDNVKELVDIIKNTQEGMAVRNVGEQAAKQIASTPVCPDHDKPMKTSQYGGFYCSTQMPDGTWCKNKA